MEEYFGGWFHNFNRKELLSVLDTLDKEYRTRHVCPEQSNIFRAFELCPYDSCKVVMLGYDPYPQKGVATGIMFGNNNEEIELSPSLKILKESVINFGYYHNYINFDNSLESWAKQGVLMLNSSLTVEMNRTGSHVMLWRPFISSFLKNLSDNNTGIVYVLFGSQAATFKPYINNRNNHILEEKHPAYYARTGEKMPNSLFADINKIITGLYGEPIIWYTEY